MNPGRSVTRPRMPILATALVVLLSMGEARADDAFTRCLTSLRPAAAKQGVSAATFERYTAGLTPDPTVLEAMDAQPEFVTPIWDYLAVLVDGERIADGQRRLREHDDTLKRVAARYGVDAQTVVAVWGVESDYGRSFGQRPLLRSLATLACRGRRQDYFRPELYAALAILQAGDVHEDALRGSWAGAFGHTQFMPTTFRRVAVDFDGDGRRDLVGNAVDALASTANYLARAGWRRGEGWGFEVRVPKNFDANAAQRRNKHPLSHWAQLGVRRADGSELIGTDAPASRATAILLPAGREGPAFAVFRNFDAIFSYNAAQSYALAIALLSDRLRGKPDIAARWPTDDPGLARVERRELQTLLIARGHHIGEVDGLIGAATRAAIVAEQKRLGLPADGRAGRRVLDALRD